MSKKTKRQIIKVSLPNTGLPQYFEFAYTKKSWSLRPILDPNMKIFTEPQL